MPELRHNPMNREWVIIATERAKRPHELIKQHDETKRLSVHSASCPLCPGNEHMTPQETMRLDWNGQWQVRVVPNKFPALSSEGEPFRRTKGLRRSINGVGIHEVIVTSPDHSQTPALMSAHEVELILKCYHLRYLALSKDQRIDLITIFKNHGVDAGTSLEHPHSQVIGAPIIPAEVRGRMEDALRFYNEESRCLGCSVLREELDDRTRIIQETPHFVAFIPYASLSPFSLYIFPRRHMATFGEIHAEEITDLAEILQGVLAKLYHGLGNPSYNYVIRTAPNAISYSRYYHWYLSLIPRLTRVAGFEMGSGMFINVTLPEADAEYLRNVEVPCSAAVLAH